MTPTWYNTPARIAALETAVNRWIGTPYRDNSAVVGRGGGVSCHNLVGEFHFETGCLARFTLPKGHPRALMNGPEDRLIGIFDEVAVGLFTAVDPKVEMLLPGDVIVTRGRRNALHLGTMVSGGQFAHVRALGGVMRSVADASQGHHVAAIRRPNP